MKALQKTDPAVAELVAKEEFRQASVLRLIPSENYASAAVMEAAGSCLANKYSEGYAHQRYYQGQEYIDAVEDLAVSRAKQFFSAEHANVQPYSGSPANAAAYLAVLRPGDKVMGMDLAAGGHLTHGAKVSFSGKFYQIMSYGLSPETNQIDYGALEKAALEYGPKLVVAGASSYPRVVDFAAIAKIAKKAGALFMADISHISGLCATGCHPHPFPHADIVTTTTHKMLRGPRGGLILCKKELAAAIDKAVFPGMQGGPHNQTTAAIAVALKEAMTPGYTAYCKQVVANCKLLAQRLMEQGIELVTGGTDNHLCLIDATGLGLSGNGLAVAMEKAGLVANSNKIPFDPRPANDPSGVRLGTCAITSRGMKEPEMELLAGFIVKVARDQSPENLDKIRAQVAELCRHFPAPGLETVAV